MGFLTQHQNTAVTSIINDCCAQGETSDDDYYIDSQLSYLLDAIRNQNDFTEPGAVEAARALRKKMKYGSTKEQYNALRILDLLVTNVNSSLVPLYNDDKLLDRLQFYLVGSDSSTNKPNKNISDLAFNMMQNWYNEYKYDDSLKNIIILYERCLKSRERKKKTSRSRYSNQVPDFMNDEADMDTPFDDYYDNDDDQSGYNGSSRRNDSNRPKTNAELDKKFRIPKINYQKEAPKILQLIAQANILATNLVNTLNSLQKDELSIHSIKANDGFDECRAIRRKVLRYLQLVQREELLGPLLKCNDELVEALKKYEEKSVPTGTAYVDSDDDYDSLADYESDNEPANPPPVKSNLPSSGKNKNYDLSDSDDDDSYYARDRYPPSTASNTDVSNSPAEKVRRAPPPVPAKKSILRSPITNSVASSNRGTSQRNTRSDYDPFSDDNEVAPTSWS